MNKLENNLPEPYERKIDLSYRPSKEKVMTVWGKVGNYARQVLP